MTNIRYFTSKTFSSARHQWLCGFFNYLAPLDVVYKKESQRLQHASQMKILLNTLAADKGDAIWVKWADPHLQSKVKGPWDLNILPHFSADVPSKEYATSVPQSERVESLYRLLLSRLAAQEVQCRMWCPHHK